MGMTVTSVKYIEQARCALNMPYQGLRMCEFGNQHMRAGINTPFRTAKQYYENLGVIHTSIDINGKDGALNFNLSKSPIDIKPEFNRQFDLITDSGMIQCVDSQYWAFKNAHDIVKINGIIMHALPLIGYWPGPNKYRYECSFFNSLAEKNSYIVIVNTIEDDCKLVYSLLRVRNNRPFISEAEFANLPGLHIKAGRQ